MSNKFDYTTVYKEVKRSTFLKIDLDAILHNLRQLQALCPTGTDVIAVVKANAYGHGSVEVARHLEANGVAHFAVATAQEGVVLRQADIKGFIQCFGNTTDDEIPLFIEYNVTPTVATLDFLQSWSLANSQLTNDNNNVNVKPVIIKVDTGMSRNGCQPEEFPSLLKFCDKHKIHVHSVMTHFAQAGDDPDFTRKQLQVFLKTTEGLREKGIKRHVANSNAIINGVGVNLDFVRPGISLYGQPPDTDETSLSTIQSVGLKPALSWISHPTLVKTLQTGRYIGYDKTYRCTREETIATFSLGYADGFKRRLTGKAKFTSEDGTEHPVVGKIAMDAVTVKLNKPVSVMTSFYVMKDDYVSCNSVRQIASHLDTIPYEILTSLASRLPRVYVTDGAVKSVVT